MTEQETAEEPGRPSGVSEQLIDRIARIAHEVNRVHCRSHGDESHAPWDETPEMLRASVRAGVRAILTGEVKTADESHRAWLAYKNREGWVYGPEKNVEKKTHPCMVSYSELPPEHRLKDEFFFAVVQNAGILSGAPLAD